MRLITLLAFLVSIPTQAAYLKFGGSIGNSVTFGTKFLAIGHQDHLLSLLDYQLESGYILDNEFPGLYRALYVSIAPGFSIVKTDYYLKVFCGPALISNTDVHLSSIFEIATDIELGLRDIRGLDLGVGYKHMSNAGLVPPNLGRDFLYFKININL